MQSCFQAANILSNTGFHLQVVVNQLGNCLFTSSLQRQMMSKLLLLLATKICNQLQKCPCTLQFPCQQQPGSTCLNKWTEDKLEWFWMLHSSGDFQSGLSPWDNFIWPSGCTKPAICKLYGKVGKMRAWQKKCRLAEVSAIQSVREQGKHRGCKPIQHRCGSQPSKEPP